MTHSHIILLSISWALPVSLSLSFLSQTKAHTRSHTTTHAHTGSHTTTHTHTHTLSHNHTHTDTLSHNHARPLPALHSLIRFTNYFLFDRSEVFDNKANKFFAKWMKPKLIEIYVAQDLTRCQDKKRHL